MNPKSNEPWTFVFKFQDVTNESVYYRAVIGWMRWRSETDSYHGNINEIIYFFLQMIINGQL